MSLQDAFSAAISAALSRFFGQRKNGIGRVVTRRFINIATVRPTDGGKSRHPLSFTSWGRSAWSIVRGGG